ncbi:MAG TPA: pitrilysin family protein [Geomobilimonas sp.]|nr:pitrilysin family protein [Geomobilimonas sp.]
MITSRSTILPNGLRVVAVEMPHLHSAEIAVYLKVGGRNDSRNTAGLAHFLEHMLFRGTSEHPTSLELETAFEALGGSVNAATDEESTCYYTRIHPRHVAEGFRLFSAMLLRPTLAGLEVEKRIITEEALEDINERGEEINPHNLASRMLWPDQPLGMPTIGYLDTIAGFTTNDLRQHLARYYVPSNAVAVAAGAIEADRVFAACAAAFGDWQGSPAPVAEPATGNQKNAATLFVRDSDSQVHLQLAFRGFARQDRRIMPTRLLRRILCGGGSSRLHLALREELGIVYAVDASISAYEETGSFAIELSTAQENLPLAVARVLEETGRLAREAVPAAELERVRQGYFFDLEYSRDSTYEMQVRYGWGELMGMVRDTEEDRAEAATIDAATVQSTAGVLFAPVNLNLVAVGPWRADVKRQVEKLVKGYTRDFQGTV